MRMSAIVVCAFVINIALFVIMNNMISRDDNRLVNTYEAHTIEFMRTQIEDQTKKKDRKKKPPPKPQEAKKPKARLDDLFNQRMDLPTPVASMDIKGLLRGSGGIALGGHLVDGAAEALMDLVLENELTPVSKLPPRYPQQAAMREQEGYVKVLITIRPDGTVGETQVVEAEPRGVFDRAAVAAVRRWRYKPVLRNGQPTAVRAYITMDFELEDE